MIKKLIVIVASILPNFLKIFLYRLIGYKIGKNVKIGFLTVILAKKVTIKDNVSIGTLNIFKMNQLSIGEDSRIRSLNMMIGPKDLKLGKRIQIVGPFTFMNLSEDIILDDHCGLGSHSIFYTHGVYLPYTEGHPRKFGKIHLGKRVWSPCHVIFLPGASIGDDSIISAGSLVNGTFPNNSFISGSPAKRISDANNLKTKMTLPKREERIKEILLGFKESHFSEEAKLEFTSDGMILRKRNKSYLIARSKSELLNKSSSYREVVILGDNLKKRIERNVSIFDFKERKMKISGELGKIFLEYLGTYGEYFNPL